MLKENFIELYQNSFNEHWKMPALTDYFKNEDFTYAELATEIVKLHILFDEVGIKKGDKIAVIGRNNPRWCISFMASITYGAVVVPILQDFNANDVHHIINHSESKLLFAGDRYWDYIDTEQVPNLVASFSLTDFACFWTKEKNNARKLERCNIERLFSKKHPKGLAQGKLKFSHIPNENLVLLNYTSGTTGFSKGVMLTANNLCGNVLFGKAIQMHFVGSRGLSFLPLAHAYGCAFDFLHPLMMGSHITLLGKIPSPKVLLDALKEVKPHILFMVPLIIEKIYKKQILPMMEKKIFKLSMRVPIIDAKVNEIIRNRLVKAFGGEIYQVIIGGAALNSEVEAFLTKIKFPFTVGYGMSECGPLISYTDYKEFKPTSCGKVLPNLMEVRIDSNDQYNTVGEIQVRGQHVMKGYYKNEKATSEAFTEDGWLRTGDVGTIDPDNTIYIRGRSKTMILSSSGQNIYPEEIESKLNNLQYVNESLIIERAGKLVALVYPDYEQMDTDGKGNNSSNLKEAMEENRKTLNTIVAPYEQVSEVILYPNEFEKTPKKSIKRYLYNV